MTDPKKRKARGSCARVGPRLSGFLDGELDEGGAQRVRAHLGRCAACAARLEGLVVVARALRLIVRREPEAEEALRPRRFNRILDRLSSARRQDLCAAIGGVVARRLLRRLRARLRPAAAGAPPLPNERTLCARARALLSDLAVLLTERERARLVRLDELLRGSEYEPLRACGLFDPLPPRVPHPSDLAGRAAARRWAEQALAAAARAAT